MKAKQTAVVLLELQNDFLTEGGKLYPLLKPVLAAYDIKANQNELIRAARASGMLIVHVPIGFSADYREMGDAPYGILQTVKNAGALIKDTWGSAIAEGIDIQADDIVVEGKSGIDAFAGTHLDFVLRSHGVTSITLAGQLTNICIESTMRAAYDKGYRVFGITDASATIGLEQYNASIEHNWPMFSEPMTHNVFLDRAAA